VDGRDHWLPQLVATEERGLRERLVCQERTIPVVLRRPCPGEQRDQAAEIRARREGVAGAGENRDPQLVVIVELAPRLRQPHDHLRRQRVLLGWPVEGDERDAVSLLEQEIAHGASPERGRKNGSFSCSPAASKTTSTGRSSARSDGARPRRPETM